MNSASGGSCGNKILLVEDNQKTRNMHAVFLSTHGYDVESACTTADAYVLWNEYHPDLVLLSFAKYTKGVLEFWEGIKRVSPWQRIAFLHDESVYLCPVLYNGNMVRTAEVAADFVDRVQALLPLPALGRGHGEGA